MKELKPAGEVLRDIANVYLNADEIDLETWADIAADFLVAVDPNNLEDELGTPCQKYDG